MELQEIMQQRVFVVAGDTLNEEKYAHKIKAGLLEHGYTVHAVGKELSSINDVEGDIDIIDLCINPVKGLQLMQECRKSFKSVVLQPGAESTALIAYLQEHQIPYLEGCLLVGMRLYCKPSK